MKVQEIGIKEKLHTLGKDFIKVFLVDDDSMYLKLMKHQIKEFYGRKVRVETFHSGVDCLKSMHMKPDIIVMDHFLDDDNKDLTGLDFLNKIRKGYKGVEVIMISASDDIRLAAYSVSKGAIGFITKSKDAMGNLLLNIQKALLRLTSEKENQDQKNFKLILGVTLCIIAFGLTVMNYV